MLHGFAHGVDHAIAGGFGAPQRTAAAHRFAGDHAGGVLARQLGVFVHHPAHHLRGGAHIRRGHVLARTDVLPDLLDPAAAQAFFLADGERGRVNDHAALAAAQRDIRHGAFPGHPGGQRAHGIDRLSRVEANAALVGAAGVVVLHAEAFKDADRAVIHAHRDAEVEFAQRPAQDLAHLRVQLEQLGHMVKLSLRHFKSIGCSCHWFSSYSSD